MRISRLYQSIALQHGETIELDDDSAHYVRTVLRLKKGSAIIVFNNQGGEFAGAILEASRKRVVIDINEWIARDVESNLQVNFGLAISKGSRMDFAIQKSVELGVNDITPLVTERSVVRLTDDSKQQKIRHWQKIAQHAAEQSGRTLVPAVNDVLKLADWIGNQVGLRIFLDPRAQKKLTELQPEQEQMTLLAGPEGGFSESERDTAKESGFIPVQLGSRILRSETAALAALAAAQTLWGDYG
jgi:16S rRNA (uracil1498-N3)-methyltransferase